VRDAGLVQAGVELRVEGADVGLAAREPAGVERHPPVVLVVDGRELVRVLRVPLPVRPLRPEHGLHAAERVAADPVLAVEEAVPADRRTRLPLRAFKKGPDLFFKKLSRATSSPDGGRVS
jgi:hypothetical protein